MSNYKTLVKELREYITDTFLIGDESFKDDDPFLTSGIVDSTGILEVVSHVEQKYKITIDNADMRHEKIGSVENLADLILDKREIANETR